MRDRRSFLKLLTSAAAVSAGMVLDPERALWVRGAKSIFLPPAKAYMPNVWAFEVAGWSAIGAEGSLWVTEASMAIEAMRAGTVPAGMALSKWS